MDIRLLIDGGASPQAPPGKTAEPPPAREEFEKTLQTARKEDAPGEVADKEPNAQLQKLDPESKNSEAAGKPSEGTTKVGATDKKGAATKDSVPSIPLPVQIDPAIFAQLQQVGIAQLGVPVALIVKPSAEAPQISNGKQDSSIKADLKIDPTGPVLDLKGIDKAVVATSNENSAPNLDATKNATISALVATAFSSAPVKGGDSKVTAEPRIGQQIAVSAKADAPTPIDEAKPVEAKLNITSIQSTTTAISTQLDSSQNATKVQASGNGAIITSKAVIVADQKEVVAEVEATSIKSVSDIRQDGSESSSSKDKEKDSNQSPTPNQPAPVQTSDIAKTTPTSTPHQLTPTERQAMVDTMSKKIDELAANSVRNEVRVEMHPPELGSIIVSIRKDMAGLSATLNASNEPLRQALHESKNDLAGALAARNVGQVKIEVRGASADTMNMGQHFGQAQSQQQNQQSQTKQTSQSAGTAVVNQKESTDQPVPTRTATTLLDMEI